MPELFSQVLDLKEKDVFLETEVNDTRYFSISGLPFVLSYGKHPFSITFNDPEGQPLLKNLSNIVFEFVDSRGTVIFSDLIDISELSGAGNGFVWIKKNPLRTANEIADGPAYLYVMGELNGDEIPNEWKGIYNVRSTFVYDIRKDYPNTSPLFLKSPIDIQSNFSISESIEFDTGDSVFKRSFINVSLTDLETVGGKIESVELGYNEQKAKTDDFEIITTYPLTSGSFETTDQSAKSGLNPLTNTTKIVTPKKFRRSTPTRFRLRFLNPAKQLAQFLDEDRQGEIVEITSSFITFDSAPFFVEKTDNLLTGSLSVGRAVGRGFTFSGKRSAELSTVDYKGFTSASAGSGSGIMMFSGSVKDDITDDYASGGVGLELVADSSSFFRFRTNPKELDIRANAFFIGSETSQFISGSGGAIEISSSLFHLDPANDVVSISGSVTATDGTIGGFTISKDALSGDSFFMSGSATSTTLFISSSGFQVDALGTILANAGLISNFKLNADKILFGGGGNGELRSSVHSNGPAFAMGVNTETFTTGVGKGIFASGSGHFHLGNPTGSGLRYNIDRDLLQVIGTISGSGPSVGGSPKILLKSLTGSELSADTGSFGIISVGGGVFTSASLASGGSGGGGSGDMNDVIDDTTPQLGGNLDLNSNDITGIGNIDITGDITAQNFIVSSSVTSITFQALSGSTIFGDSSDDTHEFIGNTISGSSTSTGSFGELNIKQQRIYERSNDLIIEGVDGENKGDITFRTGLGSGVRDVAHIDYAGAVVIGAGATIPADNHTGGGGSLTVFNTGTSIIKIANNTTGQDANSGTDLQLTSGTSEFLIINRDATDIKLKSNGNEFRLDASANAWSGSSTSTGSFGHLKIKNTDVIGTTNGIAIGGGTNFNSPSLAFEVTKEIDNNYVALFRNIETTAGRNFGLYVRAGTNASDFALQIRNKDDSLLTRVDGTGNLLLNAGDVRLTSGNVSGSSTSTGSFGRVNTSRVHNVNRIEDDGSELTIRSDDLKTVGDGITIKDSSGSDKITFALDSTPTEIGGAIQFNNALQFASDLGTKISGSSTSTGSFGVVHAADKVRIGLTNDDSPHLLEMKAGATGGDFIIGRQSDGGQAFRVGLDSGDDGFLELGSAGTSNVVVLSADGTSHFNGGNVGIGASPSFLFHVQKQVDGDYVGFFKNSDSDNGFGVGIDAGDDANVRALQIRNHNGSAESFIVDGAGNALFPRANAKISGSATSTGSFGAVAIGGTFSPASLEKLVVKGDIGVGNGSDARLRFNSGASRGHIAPDQNVELRFGFANSSNKIFYHSTTEVAKINSSGITVSSGNISGSSTSTGSFGSVHTSGNIGIGTTSPTDRLHIIGGGITMVGASNSSAISMAGSDGTVDGFLFAQSGEIGFLDAGGDHAIKYKNDDSIKFFLSGGTEKLVINDTQISGSSTSTGSFGHGHFADNLGINTISPLAPLHIRNDGSTTLLAPLLTDTRFLISSLDGSASTQGAHFGILSGNADSSSVYFGRKDKTDAGKIEWDNSEDAMYFYSGSTKVFEYGTSPSFVRFFQGIFTNSNISSSFGRITATGNVHANAFVGSGAGLTGVTVSLSESDMVPSGDDTQIQFNSGGTLGGAQSLTLLNADGPNEKFKVSAALGIEVSSGNISGSATSTGSFGQGFVTDKLGIGTLSPNKALEVVGQISASNSVFAGRYFLNNLNTLAHTGTLLTIANDNTFDEIIYGLNSAATHEFKGAKISGSSTSTGSFGRVEATKFSGDGSALTGIGSSVFPFTGNAKIKGDFTVENPSGGDDLISASIATRTVAIGDVQGTESGTKLVINDDIGKIFVPSVQTNFGIGTDSPNSALHLFSTAAAKPKINLESQNAGTQGPQLDFFVSSSSPAVADEMGDINFAGMDSTGVKTFYASIRGMINNPTNGSETGRIQLSTRVNGSSSPRLVVSGSNVGIGTSSPGKTLDVVGEGRFSSDVTIGSGGSTPDLIFDQGDSQITGPLNANFLIKSRGNSADEGVSIQGADSAGLKITKAGDAIFDGNVSGSATSTGSFGRLRVAGTSLFSGDITAERIYQGNGTEALPSHTYDNDRDSGMYRAATNELGFSTAGNERVRINASGNVGIGTSDPKQKLHVSTGNDSNSGNITFLIGGTEGTNARTGRIIKNTSSPFEMTIRANDFSGTGDLILNDDGGNILFPSSNTKISGSATSTGSFGRLGVGIAEPTANKVAQFHGFADGFGYIQISDTNVGGGISDGMRIGFNSGTARIQNFQNSDIQFFVNDSTEVLTLESDGSATFPTANAKISGSSTSTGSFGLVLQNGSPISGDSFSDGTPTLISGSSSSTGSFGRLMIDDSIFGKDSAAGSNYMQLLTAVGGKVKVGQISGGGGNGQLGLFTDGNEALHIDDSGNVGINTDGPITKLHVKGTIRAQHSSDTADYVKILHDGTDGHVVSNRGALKLGSQSDEDALVINSAGNALVGHNSSVNSGGNTPKLQVSDNDNDASIGVYNYGNNAAHFASLRLAHSKNGTIGSHTVLADNDKIGTIEFNGSDGSNFDTIGARIIAEVDGTPASNRMPSALTFSTAAGGSDDDITERMRIDSSGHLTPSNDDTSNLGASDKRWSDVFAVQTTTGGVFETGLRTEKIGDNPTGTIVSWNEDGLVPCDKNEDELVMGVIKQGKDEPIVLGAEPVLVTGKVDIGDYIVTSDKIGHGKAVKRGYLLKKDLFGKVIAQALEPSDDSDSCLIKCMIRKM